MPGDLHLKVNATETEGSQVMKTERRWLKSIIAASTDSTPALPFQRGAKRKPAAFKLVTVKTTSIAAR
jgi:hypothetical protein